MDEINSETALSQQAEAQTATEKSVQFINAEVLAPPEASPMGGITKVMIEQSTGMMVQDLQSFLKGFEQLGLIAISRLANNLLTYGTWSENKPPPGISTSSEIHDNGQGNEMIRDLFKMVSEYAEAKTKISNAMFQPNFINPMNGSGADNPEIPSKPVFSSGESEKKNL
ncbi:hypothetical protein [Chryseobacterium sp. GP-SGM7]|uniref:hypothetical protein n=1 Tax=Chryseobacterium sp. GP-SGM7 TaxID=3411323 RepID=UPI003B92CDBB